MLELSLAKPIPAGRACLRLAFSGRLRRDLCGLYAARSGPHRFAFTQLEATDARKFFPCFDEPAMKARFRIAVTTTRANRVLSNAPVQRTKRLPGGRQQVCFEETPPLSTYLVALAVGPLEATAPVRLGPTPIRVWHVPGKRRLTAFALEAAQRLAGPSRALLRPPLPLREARSRRGSGLRVRRDGERRRRLLPRDAAAARSRDARRWPSASAPRR